MRSKLVGHFLLRWLGSGLGLWIAAAFLGPERLSYNSNWIVLVVAGFILALLNMFFKPLLVFLSIPALLLTLGLFMLVVNGLLILIVSWLYDSFEVKNLWVAIIAGLIVGLVNYLVTRIVEGHKK